MRNFLVPKLKVPTPDAIPAITPLPRDTERPRWSVMIPTLNRPNMLRHALESVLAEGYSEQDMQIRVIDNATDNADIEAIVREIAGDRVEYFRQPETIHLGDNWTDCLQQARGEYIHLLHDDNVVLPGCYQAYEQHIIKTGCEAIFSQIVIMNAQEQWLNLSNRINAKDEVATDPYQIILNQNTFTIMTLVTSRKLLDQIGGYRSDFHYGLDQEFVFRIINNTRLGFLDRPYVGAISHTGQDSYSYLLNAKVAPDVILPWQYMIEQSKSTYPAFEQRAYRHLSELFCQLSLSAYYRGYTALVFRKSIWAFRFMPSLSTLFFIFSMLVKISMKKAINNPIATFVRKARWKLKHSLRSRIY